MNNTLDFVIYIPDNKNADKSKFLSNQSGSQKPWESTDITSPTFTIVNEYKGRLPHFTTSCLQKADLGDIYEAGFEEYVGGRGVVVIEWVDLIWDILSSECGCNDCRRPKSL